MASAAQEISASDWNRSTSSEKLEWFQSLPREKMDDFFLGLGTRDQTELLLSLPEGERRIWLRLLAPDDAADLIQEAPKHDRNTLLALLDEHTAKEVQALLAYAEDEAGGLMSPRFARLRPEMTADEAIGYLRRQARTVESIYYAYVLDPEQRLLGVISLRDLFSADRDRPVRESMQTDFVAAQEGLDQEKVARLFADHRLLAIPVVDGEGRMKGIVTVDDIVHVVREEAGEDIQKVGGMEALDGPYLQIGLWRMIQKRGGWLAILFAGEMLTATAMSYFAGEISKAVVLALFLPLIISSGGNSGSQATTLVIRAMALGDIQPRDWFRVVRRELLTGTLLGAMLGLIGIVRIFVWQSISHIYGAHYALIALTIAASLVGVVLFGSAPFVATLVDVTGLVIYFSIANLILRGTLL